MAIEPMTNATLQFLQHTIAQAETMVHALSHDRHNNTGARWLADEIGVVMLDRDIALAHADDAALNAAAKRMLDAIAYADTIELAPHDAPTTPRRGRPRKNAGFPKHAPIASLVTVVPTLALVRLARPARPRKDKANPIPTDCDPSMNAWEVE